MATAMAFFSCSGDDGTDGVDGINGLNGADGIDGINGTDGINGADGVDGENGADGIDGENGANAQRIIIDVSSIPEGQTSIQAPVPQLTNEILQNNILIFYLEIFDENIPSFFPIPGGIIPLDRQFNISGIIPGGVYISISNYDGSDLSLGWVEGVFSNLHIILIETTVLQGKNQDDVMANLKANGVDTSNYHDVMSYLGLE